MPRPTLLLARLLAPVADPRRFTAMVAIAFGVTAVGLLAVPSPSLAWDAGSFSATSESQLISLQNEARASAGMRSLKLDTALRQVARWRSKDMIQRDYFSHTIKGTSRNVFWYLQHTYDYCFKVAGENIGTVTWKGASVEDATNWVFDAFMNSSGHRANIMGKAWDVVAVGAYKGSGDKFMWTVLFADRCSTSPPPTPKPTPKPTPRPTAKPTHEPKHAATPRPTRKPTPEPTRKPRPESTPRRTPRPDPTPAQAPSESPSPTVAPTPIFVATLPPAATEPPTGPAPPHGLVPPGQLRVVDEAVPTGLIDSILGAVSAGFFGG